MDDSDLGNLMWSRLSSPTYPHVEEVQKPRKTSLKHGAGKEARTPDLNLGKVALYQLSYSRPNQSRNCRAERPGVKTTAAAQVTNPSRARPDAALCHRRPPAQGQKARTRPYAAQGPLKARTAAQFWPGESQVQCHGPEGQNRGDEREGEADPIDLQSEEVMAIQ